MFAIERRTKLPASDFFVNGVATLSWFKRSLMMSFLGIHVIALVLAGRCPSTNPKLSFTFSPNGCSLKSKG
jgi:hypothetical protein